MKKLVDTVKFLNAIGIDNSQILICGSYALKIQGINTDRVPHDVDVCILPNKRHESIIKGITDSQHNTYYKEFEYNIPECTHKPYIFQLGGIDVNIWFMDFKTYLCFFDEKNIQLNGCKIQPVNKVLDAKKSYNREKDWEDIGHIINNIMKSDYGNEKVIQTGSNNSKSNK